MARLGKKGTKSSRTKSGNVSATARKKHGMKSASSKKGSFPIFDHKSAMSALRLRGRTRSKKDRVSIINRARKFASAAAKKAYAVDKSKARI